MTPPTPCVCPSCLRAAFKLYLVGGARMCVYCAVLATEAKDKPDD